MTSRSGHIIKNHFEMTCERFTIPFMSPHRGTSRSIPFWAGPLVLAAAATLLLHFGQPDPAPSPFITRTQTQPIARLAPSREQFVTLLGSTGSEVVTAVGAPSTMGRWKYKTVWTYQTSEDRVTLLFEDGVGEVESIHFVLVE